LHIDERILHYLAGINDLDQRLRPLLQASAAPDWIAAAHERLAQQAARALDMRGRDAPVLQLCGDDPQGQEDVAAFAARALGHELFVLPVDDIPAPGAELNQFVTLWEREALLLSATLFIQCAPCGFSAAARHLAERLPAPLFLASREPLRLRRPFLRVEVEKPPPVEQKQIWARALGPAAGSLNGMLDNLSQHFRLSAKAIHATTLVTSATTAPRAATEANAMAPEKLQPSELWSTCRAMARPRLEDLAQRIMPSAGWEDLILPEPQMQTLRQLADQIGHRMQVHENWGFADKGRRGLGVSALFAGASGTGKTLAAEVLARDLDLDLYRIDLSAVVSKYIGETEKNLRQVFDAAEEGGALLLFDEADALFGKRSDVKDSHDRYANIEIGYLLQRMEAYQGLAILTTNLKSTMDKAFQRRLRFVVNFPFPDAVQREAIWGRVFPARTPTESLETKRLARLNVAGGNIRNIALNAAFLAAAAGQPVGMRHLLEAAQLEAQKIERPLSEAEVRGWA
ncbi:ATP-binding protein, partial [Bradyrhizobium sp.]|uniref:ATP-binding protein n=1 Tax=Bradyrhizobium sp. TaxID=376 RepID=UPI003C6EFF48